MSAATATPHGLACLTMTTAGSLEAVHQPPRRLGVVEVEVRQLLAAVLHGVVPPAAGADDAGSGRPAGAGSRRSAASCTRSSAQVQRGRAARRARAGRVARRTSRDRRVVGRGAGERLLGQAPAGRRRERAGLAQLVEHRPVLRRIDHDADVGVVLGRGADHGRPADVDQLDAGLRRRTGRGWRRARSIGSMPSSASSARCSGWSRSASSPRVDRRVQRHDAVAEDGREAGQLGDVGDRAARRRRSPSPCRRSRRGASRARAARRPARPRRSCRRPRATRVVMPAPPR